MSESPSSSFRINEWSGVLLKRQEGRASEARSLDQHSCIQTLIDNVGCQIKSRHKSKKNCVGCLLYAFWWYQRRNSLLAAK